MKTIATVTLSIERYCNPASPNWKVQTIPKSETSRGLAPTGHPSHHRATGHPLPRCSPAAAARFACWTWRRSRRWRRQWLRSCRAARRSRVRAGPSTTAFSSSTTPSMAAPATCSSPPSRATSWNSNSMTASAAGTPATPPNFSTPPSASPCPRYTARSRRSARELRRTDGGRVSEPCVWQFGFDWLVRGYLSVVMMSYMVCIHTVLMCWSGSPAEQWTRVSQLSCAWRTGFFGWPSSNAFPGASSARGSDFWYVKLPWLPSHVQQLAWEAPKQTSPKWCLILGVIVQLGEGHLNAKIIIVGISWWLHESVDHPIPFSSQSCPLFKQVM